jgi:uncharacterized protein (TIGR03435 family)
MKHALAALSWVALSVLTTSGQTASEAPEFEVASVKPSAPDSAPFHGRVLPGMLADLVDTIGFSGGPGSKDPGRIDYKAVTLKRLLARAYDVKTFQISGPGWLDTERYDIAAKLPPGTDSAKLRLMLQRLLTERFRITLHRETKEQPVYRLVVAKGGPKLKPPEEEPHYKDEAEQKAAMQAKAAAQMEAMRRRMEKGGPHGSSRFHYSHGTMRQLAESLSSNLDRPVRDMTNLPGKDSFSLEWVPESSTPPAASANGGDAARPSIFVAIQQQLGRAAHTTADTPCFGRRRAYPLLCGARKIGLTKTGLARPQMPRS